MQYKLFIANLPAQITADELREMLMGQGEIARLELLVDEETGELTGRASLTLVTEEAPEVFLAWMNDLRYADQRLAVSFNKPLNYRTKLSKGQRKLARQIAEQLAEEEQEAQHTITRIVRFCGAACAQGLLADTLAIEAQGGLWLDQHNRRRTPGGVYLHLARQRLSSKMRRAIFRFGNPKTKRSASAPVDATATEEDADTQAGIEGFPALDEALPPATSDPASPSPASSPPPAADIADEQPAVERPPGDRLAELRQAHQAAQDLLTAIKNGQVQGSALEAMKQVLETKLALDQFRQQYPELV